MVAMVSRVLLDLRAFLDAMDNRVLLEPMVLLAAMAAMVVMVNRVLLAAMVNRVLLEPMVLLENKA
jgi:hypothetical protein